ncbi:MAG: hypothetical protein U0989_10960 [Azonexus sp.]|nr:hypothetical protein [Azonexus sp.]MDZ4315268.1 hypothetical protein [Azonexus sp.]
MSIKPAIATILLLSLLACTGGPVTPDWQNNAHQSLNSFSTAYLSGDTRLANAEFQRARNELARTGRFDLVARAELVRCGVRVASLELDDCPGFSEIGADAGKTERDYADFLQGKAVAATLLPAQYRAMAGKGKSALSEIDSPLSRLIAGGVLLRRGDLDTTDIAVAVETASAQGWRRALLAWLEIQARQAESQGDENRAAYARRRAELSNGER